MLKDFSVVPHSERTDFLPLVFGDLAFLAVESGCYNVASKHLSGYRGGYWEYVINPEGFGYLRPTFEGTQTLTSSWDDLSVSADAAGLAITIMTCNLLIWAFHEKGVAAKAIQKLINNYEYLLSRYDDHPENPAIWRFLD